MSLVENLKYDFGDFRIEIPKWEIPDKGITALWGPSGSGKTTVFRFMLGLDPCPGMSWVFQGEDLTKVPVQKRNLGVVFQTLELFPHMTAKENILFAADARKIPKTEAQAELKSLLEELQLVRCQNTVARKLSGGEKQRAAIARALIGRPRFLFLDEPFASLDLELRQDARKLIKRVIADRKVPTLLITHDPEDVKDLADTVVQINDGQLA